TPARLAGMLRDAEDGDPIAYLELAEAMEEKDPDYLGVLGTRKRAVSQLEITVTAASDESADEDLAEFLRATLLEREELEDELFDMLDAVGKGFSATEILWETSEREWRPARLEWRDPRWFRFDRVDGRTLRLLDEGGQETPLSPFKFIVHVHKAKSGLPIRGGLARPIAWAYLFKNYAVKDWATFLEAYAQPWRLGKYHAGATEDEKRKLLSAVGGLSSDAAAIIPEGMAIDMLEMGTKGATSDAYEKNADFWNRRMQIAVLGQTLTTEVKGGSFAAAKVHDAVRDDIKRADAKQLAATLNRDLVRPMIDLNKGPQRRYPRLVIGLRESVNLKEYSEAMGAMIDRGLQV
ncbi:MAG: DUF935 domain-containing protein, partial [Candidatus Methylomirabilis sp.]|nr:DUF935 domain-containing protein [Deltaproteobacteria bacterium]